MSSPENIRNIKSESESRKIPEFAKEAAFGAGLSMLSLGVVQQFERGNLGINPPELFTGHIHDTLASVGISYFYRIPFQGSRLINAAIGFAAPSAYEIGQRFGLLDGTYDPKDFIAYGVGASVYYAVERFRNRSREVKYSSNEI